MEYNVEWQRGTKNRSDMNIECSPFNKDVYVFVQYGKLSLHTIWVGKKEWKFSGV